MGTAIAANRPTVDSAGSVHLHPTDVSRPVHRVREADRVHRRTLHGRGNTVGDRKRGNLLDLNQIRGIRNDQRGHIAQLRRQSAARRSNLAAAV